MMGPRLDFLHVYRTGRLHRSMMAWSGDDELCVKMIQHLIDFGVGELFRPEMGAMAGRGRFGWHLNVVREDEEGFLVLGKDDSIT